MESGEDLFQILNPFLEGLHKVETKLKCPVCTKFLDEPILLPCDHIICQNCLPTVNGKKLTCPLLCVSKFHPRDAKVFLCVKEMIKIFNNMDCTISEFFKQITSPKSELVEENGIQAIPPDLKDRNLVLNTSEPCQKDEADVSRSAKSSICIEKQTDARDAAYNQNCAPDMSPSSSCEIIRIVHVGSNSKSSLKNEEFEIQGGISGNTNPSSGAAKSPKRRREDKSTIGSGELKRCKLPNSLKFETKQQVIKSQGRPINKFHDECAFCHSFRIPQLYGPIVCYLNGILMNPEEAEKENVIYVHEKCVNWAPNVYYSDGKVMNLEKEIKRAEKLLCSRCGVKGAVLGCSYGPCRRTYHATCALQIDCSWDSVNLKMLCPAHADEKPDNFIPDV